MPTHQPKNGLRKESSRREDLRVRRTHLAIRLAFIALVGEKGFDALVIQDIADRAMINRGTFYKHYRDKYELLEHTIRELLSEAAAPVETLLQTPASSSTLASVDELASVGDADDAIFKGLVRWLEQVSKHPKFYAAILGTGAFESQAVEYFESLIARIALPRKPLHQPEHPLSSHHVSLMIERRFIASGVLGITKWWLKENHSISAQHVVADLHELLKRMRGV